MPLKTKSKIATMRDSIKENTNRLNEYTVESSTKELEFLEAIENEIDELFDEINDQIKEKDQRISELESELSDKVALIETIKTTGHIYYSAMNMADQQVMEALTVAYETLSPARIIQRLKG